MTSEPSIKLGDARPKSEYDYTAAYQHAKMNHNPIAQYSLAQFTNALDENPIYKQDVEKQRNCSPHCFYLEAQLKRESGK
ncbi:MAG: hypothetical protein ACPGUD_08640 [Parashewanella sp.]